MGGQLIETQCLATAVVKYTFLSKADAAILILFETASDAQCIIRSMHGMHIPDVTQSLVIKYADIELTKRIRSLFKDIEKKRAKFLKELHEQRTEQREENKEQKSKDAFLENTEMK